METDTLSNDTQQTNNEEQDKAARVLQSHFRQYHNEREERGMKISSSARWNEVYKAQRRKSIHEQAGREAVNDPSSRWRRGGFFAARLVEPQSGPGNDQSLSSAKHTKTMDIRYWLEMVDTKHRYGSNLKDYHTYWNDQYAGDQNFFYWLDHGEGRELDLEHSPRERLDREQIIYLNIDQRRNYLVQITPEGKLVWAKDGRPVDTARGRHRDLGNGQGIVDATEEEFKAAQDRGEIPRDSESSFSSLSGVSSILDEDTHHYAQTPQTPTLRAKIKRQFDPKAIMDNLLRKTLNANTWIFVADKSGNLYVGLKQTGRFQHSSFLGGSDVLAAGLLRANQGQLTSLSPLSGHYRAGSDQFKEFVEVLEHEWGCDMSKVSISRSLLMITALEKYAQFSKGKEEVKAKVKEKLHLKSRKQAELDAKKAKEEAEDKPAKLAAQRLKDREKWLKYQQDVKVAFQAGETERQAIKTAVGTGKKLSGSTTLPPLPYEGKSIQEMTEHQRIERGATLIVRAMSRPMKSVAE